MSTHDYLEENRFFSKPNESQALVCQVCINNTFLIRDLQNEFLQWECSFCSHERLVVDTALFFEQVMQAIEDLRWNFAEDFPSLYYDEEMQNFLADLEEVRDVAVRLCIWGGIENQMLLNCLYDKFTSSEVTWKFYDADDLNDNLRSNWEKFEDSVHQYDSALKIMTDSNAMFTNLMQYIGTNCIKFLETNDILYRGRYLCKEAKITPEDFGPPPIEASINTRMSPKGVPALYLSSSYEGASNEASRNSYDSNLAIAALLPKVRIAVIDLTQIHLPDPFDRENRHYWLASDFLNGFGNKISKKIAFTDNPKEYLPTQFISKYLKDNFKDKGVEGIKYPSSKHKNGDNYIIFCDEIAFEDRFNVKNISWLNLC